MNDPAGAVRLLNSLQLEVIASEESEAANQLLLWMEKNPIMAQEINPTLITWAQENKSE